MGPRPYSERAAPPHDSDDKESVPSPILAESPSASTISGATTPSPTFQEVVTITEPFADCVDIEDVPTAGAIEGAPCYPNPDDIMPYDHSLPDFIRQITNQPNLANLQSLSLRVISTLISLHRMSSYLPNLRELNLEGSILNSLRDIGCSLKNLQILKVGRCQLESLDGTFGLSSLKELYAQKNFINDVSPCSNLPHIRHIDVSGNRIRNISYAGFLSVCSKLKSIVFSGNPAAELPDYRSHVRRILPQVDVLDGVSFFTEESNEESKESEEKENSCGGSDSRSTENADFFSVGLSSTANDSMELEEDPFAMNKKNKHAKNLASQDHFEASDIQVNRSVKASTKQEESEFSKNYETESQKERNFMKLQKSLNVKQKCASIQKLDKDNENRSKKSSLTSNAGEETDEPGYPLEQVHLIRSHSESFERHFERKMAKPSSASGSIRHGHFDDIEASGAIKKRPLTATSKPTDDSCGAKNDYGVGNLTTGLPICGNLTAALRSRKKAQAIHDEEKLLNSTNSEEDTDSENELIIQLNGSGDSIDISGVAENEEDMIEADVMTTSRKWREAFRRYRSNNRGNWEEENKWNPAETLTSLNLNVENSNASSDSCDTKETDLARGE